MSNNRGPGYDPQMMTVRTEDGHQVPRAAVDLVSPNDMSPERRAEQFEAARELGLGSGFHVPGSWGEKLSPVVNTGKADSTAVSAAENLKKLLTEKGLDTPLTAGAIRFGSPLSEEYGNWKAPSPEDYRNAVSYLNSLTPSPRPELRKPRAHLATAPQLHTHAFSRSSSKTDCGVRARSRIKRIGIARKAGMTFRGFGGKVELSEEYVSEES